MIIATNERILFTCLQQPHPPSQEHKRNIFTLLRDGIFL